MKQSDLQYHRRRKWFGILSLIAFALLLVLLTLFFSKILKEKESIHFTRYKYD